MMKPIMEENIHFQLYDYGYWQIKDSKDQGLSNPHNCPISKQTNTNFNEMFNQVGLDNFDYNFYQLYSDNNVIAAYTDMKYANIFQFDVLNRLYDVKVSFWTKKAVQFNDNCFLTKEEVYKKVLEMKTDAEPMGIVLIVFPIIFLIFTIISGVLMFVLTRGNSDIESYKALAILTAIPIFHFIMMLVVYNTATIFQANQAQIWQKVPQKYRAIDGCLDYNINIRSLKESYDYSDS